MAAAGRAWTRQSKHKRATRQRKHRHAQRRYGGGRPSRRRQSRPRRGVPIAPRPAPPAERWDRADPAAAPMRRGWSGVALRSDVPFAARSAGGTYSAAAAQPPVRMPVARGCGWPSPWQRDNSLRFRPEAQPPSSPTERVTHTRCECPFRVTTAHPTRRDPAEAHRQNRFSEERPDVHDPVTAVTRPCRGARDLACGGSPRLHSVGPIRSCRPYPEMRVFAFASYVAALDSEEAAAADLAALACPAAA
jgi:hypothetical protein